MARKQRRRPTNRTRQRQGQQPPPQAQPQPAAAPASTMSMSPSGAARPGAPTRVGGDQALVRAVEMSLAPAPAATARRGSRLALPETGDASIPLDRVPYFTSDLVRVAITGAIMIALLIVAALTIIPQVVK